MIRFKNVNKTYQDGFEAVKSLNLHVDEGEFVTLIGPSGCGKTTTMKMINKLIEPTSGTIYVNGEDIANVNGVELRRNIGYVIQQIGLLPHMTIAQNIALIPQLKGWGKERYENRVDELLDLVGMDPGQFRSKYPLELSGGQQQRVGVVRALAGEPPIILMDEPFSALDPISREQLQDELKALQQRIHKTIVFVTHDIDEALKLADRIAVMKEGEIIQMASPQMLLSSPANGFVRDFLGEDRLTDHMDGFVEDIMVEDCIYTEEEIPHQEKEDPSKVFYKKSSAGHYMGAYAQELPKSEYPSVIPGTPLQKAALLLIDEKLPSLPVVDMEKRLLGVITKDQLLGYYAGLGKKGAS